MDDTLWERTEMRLQHWLNLKDESAQKDNSDVKKTQIKHFLEKTVSTVEG